MVHGDVVSQWEQVGGVYQPKLLTLDPSADWSDVTGQRAASDPDPQIIPDPNAVTLYVVVADQTTMDAIGADADHTVLWSEEI